MAPDLACVPLSMVNAYLVGPAGAPDRGWLLVDTGLASSSRRIEEAAAERFGASSRPSAIVLTHGHFDHAGSALRLSERFEAPILAHILELPYLTGLSSYPPPDPAVGGGAMSLLSRFFPRGPMDLGDRVEALPPDGTVPGLPEWRWLHTPGHSPGHISLFRSGDRTLIAGDAFVTVNQETLASLLPWGRPEVRRPPAYFTPDWGAAMRSVEVLATLQPQTAATGHGPPMYGAPLRQELEYLARFFEEEAVPRRGRYVREPAITDQNGIVSVPRPVLDRTGALILGGLAAAGLAAAVLGLAVRGRGGPGTFRRSGRRGFVAGLAGRQSAVISRARRVLPSRRGRAPTVLERFLGSLESLNPFGDGRKPAPGWRGRRSGWSR